MTNASPFTDPKLVGRQAVLSALESELAQLDELVEAFYSTPGERTLSLRLQTCEQLQA